MASYIPDLTKDNISLYLMPVGFMIALAPRFFAANTYKQATNGKDLLRNLNPRDFTAIVREDKAIDQKTKMRIARAEAAQANGFENLGLFAAAVTAASLARVDPSIVNGLTIGYLVSRVIFNHIFIYTTLCQLLQGRLLISRRGNVDGAVRKSRAKAEQLDLVDGSDVHYDMQWAYFHPLYDSFKRHGSEYC